MRWSEPVWKALTLEISGSKLRVLTEKKSELILQSSVGPVE